MPKVMDSLAQGTMSATMINKRAYFDEGIFGEECDRIFGHSWQFVGLLGELEANKSFVTLPLRDHDIVVQSFAGELRAFSNVCTHRFNRLQWESRGSRALTCRYHSWNYNSIGSPVGIERLPQFERCDTKQLQLQRYQLEVVGKFVFVNVGSNLSLPDYLGEFWRILEEVSNHLGNEIGFEEVGHIANWKLLVENVVECYHCGTVHSATFTPLGIGRKPLDQVVVAGKHSSSHFPRIAPPREHLRQKFLRHLDSRSFKHNSFYHIFIFPNLFITSSEGLSFYIGHALPVSADRTTLRLRFFDPLVVLAEKEEKRQAGIRAGVLETSLALIEEDRAVLEQIQRGVRAAQAGGILGEEEVRIEAFHQAYESALEEATLSQARSNLAGGAKTVAFGGTRR